MASVDIGLYIEPNLVVVMPSSKRAKLHFKEQLDMPEDCDGIDVTESGPYAVLRYLPRYFIFNSVKTSPKKTYKRLFL